MKKIIYTLGLVIFFSATVFSVSSATAITLPQTGLSSAGIKTILDNGLKWLLGILGTIGILGFVVSGIMYLASTGDDDMIKKAKKGMTYSIIGIVIGLSGFIVIKAIDAILNVQKQF